MVDPLLKAKDLIEYCTVNKHLTFQELYDKIYKDSDSAKSRNQKELIDLLGTTRESVGGKRG